MITKKRVTQILCIIDESDKNLNAELDKNLRLPYNGGYIKKDFFECLFNQEVHLVHGD
mgnify:CR=1 FL=1